MYGLVYDSYVKHHTDAHIEGLVKSSSSYLATLAVKWQRPENGHGYTLDIQLHTREINELIHLPHFLYVTSEVKKDLVHWKR